MFRRLSILLAACALLLVSTAYVSHLHKQDLKAGSLDEDDKGKDEDTLKADYRKIAERRIRLGVPG